MNLVKLHDDAMRAAAVTFQQINDDQWNLPTPDTDWDLRTLANHVVSENFWVAPLLGGKTVDEVGSQYDGDVLGSDPQPKFRQAADEAVAATHQSGVMDRKVHLSFGTVTAETYLEQRLIDVVIHTWDIAKAIEADTTIAPQLVDAVYEIVKAQQDMLESSGMFGDRIDVPEDSAKQTKLLALLGRVA